MHNKHKREKRVHETAGPGVCKCAYTAATAPQLAAIWQAPSSAGFAEAAAWREAAVGIQSHRLQPFPTHLLHFHPSRMRHSSAMAPTFCW